VSPQLSEMLARGSPPLIRGLGLLYARLMLPPSEHWRWLGQWLDDESPLPLGPPVAVCDVAAELLESPTFRGLRLPRVPVPAARLTRAQVLLARSCRELVAFNRAHAAAFLPGVRVVAVSSDDGEWHTAELLSLARGPDAGGFSEGEAWWVRFPEYGSDDVCGPGQLRLCPGQGAPTPEEAGVRLPLTLEQAKAEAAAAEREAAAGGRGGGAMPRGGANHRGARPAVGGGGGGGDGARGRGGAARGGGRDDLDGGARRRRRPGAAGPGRAGGDAAGRDGSMRDDRGGGYGDGRDDRGGGYGDRRDDRGGGYGDSRRTGDEGRRRRR